MSVRTTTNVRLKYKTLAYLRWLVDNDYAKSYYEIIDILIENYIQYIVEEGGLDQELVDKEAMRLYEFSRRPKSEESRIKQKDIIRKSFEKLSPKGPVKDILGEKDITKDDLKGNF